MKRGTYKREINDSTNGTCHKCQCKKLTQHTVVHGIRKLRQMTMTLVMHTFGT